MPETLPRIGLLNIMPSQVFLKTEHQWRDALSGLVDVVSVCFDDDPRSLSDTRFTSDSLPLGLAQDSLDGLIVTGANLERRADGSPLPYEEIDFHDQLVEAIDWAESRSKLSVYSCLASHIALEHLFGIRRDVQLVKTFGVFEHDTERSWLTEGLGTIKSPHSRWGNVPGKLLADLGINISAVSEEAGWLLAEYDRPAGHTVFLQGHPEYQRDDLHLEYLRDRHYVQDLPVGYYPGSDPENLPDYSWHEQSVRLFKNLVSACEI